MNGGVSCVARDSVWGGGVLSSFFATWGAAAPSSADLCVRCGFLQQCWLGSSARASVPLPAGFWAGGSRARIAFARIAVGDAGASFERGGIERRRFHRQARRHQTGGALQGESNSSGLHDCAPKVAQWRTRSRGPVSNRIRPSGCIDSGLISLSEASVRCPKPADGSSGRFLSPRPARAFMVGRARLSRCAAQPRPAALSNQQPRSAHRDTSQTRETARAHHPLI